MKYDAFISYRHSEMDMFVAKKVHKYLETFKVPKKVQKKVGKKKIKRVFRDQEELPIGSDLGNNIEYALQESEFLIVICSPRTLESEWVLKEIDTFISLHGREKCLAVLVEGEPNEAFPPQLLVDENGNPVEPLAADVRGLTKKEVNEKLKTEGMRLVASVLGCDYDDLKQRHRERIMRKYISIACGIAALGVAFGVYNAYNLAKINENYQAKLANESRALASVSSELLREGDSRTAALLAMAGLPYDSERPIVPESIQALSAALNNYELGVTLSHEQVLAHKQAVDKLDIDPESKTIISSDYCSNVYMWDLETGDMLFIDAPDCYDNGEERICNVLTDGEFGYVVTDYSIKKYDLEGNKVYSILCDKASINSYAISSERDIFVLGNKQEIEIRRASTGELLNTYTLPEEYKYTGDTEISTSDSTITFTLEIEYTDPRRWACILNEETGEIIISEQLSGNSILDSHINNNGTVSIYSVVTDNFIALSGEQEGYVDTIDTATGKILWTSAAPYVVGSSINYSYSNVEYGSYKDSEDPTILHDSVIVSGASVLYGFDVETGDTIFQTTENDNIQQICTVSDGSFSFVLKFNGKLDVVNNTTGQVKTDNAVDVSDGLTTRCVFGKGHLAVVGYMSNRLRILSYVEDDYLHALKEYEGSVECIKVSPDGSSYLVAEELDTLSYHYNFYVYDAKTDELIAQRTVDTVKVYSNAEYLDSTHIGIFPSADYLIVWDIEDSEITEPKPESESDYSFTYHQICGDYLMFKKTGEAYIIRLDKLVEQDHDSLIAFKTENFISQCDITSDGKYMFFTDYKKNCYRYNIETGEEKQILKNYRVNCLKLDPNSTRMIFGSLDGRLKLYDYTTHEVTDIMELYTNTLSKIQFSSDGNYLYLYGADYHFQVYDLTKGRIVYYYGELNTVSYLQEDAERHILVIGNEYFMAFIDTDQWGTLQTASYGKVYIPQEGRLLSEKYGTVYDFKLLSTEEIMKKAQEKYGKYELTDAQKLIYNLRDE